MKKMAESNAVVFLQNNKCVTQQRVHQVNQRYTHGSSILNDVSSHYVMYIFFVSVDCEWEPWSSWSTCSLTCGPGIKTRIRRIHSHERNGGSCNGDSIETSQESCGVCPSGNIDSILVSH